MYSNFKEQAIEYVKQAVQEDNAGNYAKAFLLYMNALEYFKTHLKYEKNPKIREAVTQKFTEYLRRAEEIRAVIDEGGAGPAANGGDAAAAVDVKPKDGEGDGEDPEQSKLRDGLNSAIVREKPNVKWNDVAGLASAIILPLKFLPLKFLQFFTASSTSSSSSSVVPRKEWTHDVFISFRGEDTGHIFVDYLYAELVRNGIHVFKDDEILNGGQTSLEEHVKPIKESRFAVVVFSKNYVDSWWCLEELSKIMECHKQIGQKVIPVYYHIYHYHVRKQSGEFARAFKEYEGRFREEVDKVKKWRDALTAAANLPGYHISPNNMSESASITEIVEEILADVEIRERKIGKISFFSDQKIGIGSNGTIVLEGYHGTRPAAVKRIVKEHYDVASKEIRNLIKSDGHPNIVRYYDVEYDRDFVYIALERCICSLHELISSPTNPTVQSLQLTLEVNGYPSPELLKLMRGTVAGLAHLHKIKFIHRDIKPQNVLISNDSSISAKVSDMGISKCLPADKSFLTSATGYGSSGWLAPETLRKEPQTRGVDLFSYGCLLFFCITDGRHPFGDDMLERDINIKTDCNPIHLSLLDGIPEAFHLVSNLIHRNPDSRPSAAEAYHHPLFWDPQTRLSFFEDASDCVELEDRVSGSILLTALESVGTVVFGSAWNGKLDKIFLTELTTGKHKKYKFNSVRDLLRAIRNKSHHYRELPTNIQALLGPLPTGYERYFSSRFPKLLMEVYKVLKQHCGGEASLNKYYQKTLD